MTFSLVVLAGVLLVVFFLARSEESTLSWGPVALGVVLAFLLMGTFAGPHLQELMGDAGSAVEGLITDAWKSITA